MPSLLTNLALNHVAPATITSNFTHDQRTAASSGFRASLQGVARQQVEWDETYPLRLELYPETKRDTILETKFGVRVADPYRWLELPDDALELKSWLEKQEEFTQNRLSGPFRETIEERLIQLLYRDSESIPVVSGDSEFILRKRADQETSVLFHRNKIDGSEKILMDPYTLSSDGSVAFGDWFPSPDGKLLAYKLHPKNSDEATLYVMDVATGQTSATDVIPGARSASPQWNEDSSGFYYVGIPVSENIPADQIFANMEIKYHKMGSDPATDTLIYERTGNPQWIPQVQLSHDKKHLLVSIYKWGKSTFYYRETAKSEDQFKTLYDGEGNADVIIENGKAYRFSNDNAPKWKVESIILEDLAAHKPWQIFIPERKHIAGRIRDVNRFGDYFVISYEEHAFDKIAIYDLNGKHLYDINPPVSGSVTGIFGDHKTNKGYYLVSHYNLPPQRYEIDLTSGASTHVKNDNVLAQHENIVSEQVFYSSNDGTLLPMTIIRHKDTLGPAPTILYGYGGFDNSLKAAFNSGIVPWLESGGVYVIANLRGGGEYGETFHKAGMGHNKQNVFDDFISGARYLVDKGITTPQQLGAYGGSNGGLLVGAAITQAPEMFGAAISAVPLLDMLRFPMFGAGKLWRPEYGDPETEADFHNIHNYSPYHQVKVGIDYPATLFVTSDKDDRVAPLHARKMAALMQSLGLAKPMMLRVMKNAGHKGGVQVRSQIQRYADVTMFFAMELGLVEMIQERAK